MEPHRITVCYFRLLWLPAKTLPTFNLQNGPCPRFIPFAKNLYRYHPYYSYNINMVQLNILSDSSAGRIYHRALELWCSHVADEAPFGTASVYANAKLAAIPEANCIIGQITPDQLPRITAYFQQARLNPVAWYLPGGQELSPLRETSLTLLQLGTIPFNLPLTHPDLTIIPARASFRHVRQIASAMFPNFPPDQAAEAACCHLDDSHVDALLAIKGSQAVGYASILSTGDAGMIMDFFILPDFRHCGYGRALAGQALDICARALFRQVIVAIDSSHDQALAYARQFGFAPALTVPCRVV